MVCCAGAVVKNRNKATCCDVLLFWILGCRWTGGGAVLLRRCTVAGAVQHDTWTTHVAIWTGHQVWTTSFLADLTVFRIAIMVGLIAPESHQQHGRQYLV